jgi:hypothetical protein
MINKSITLGEMKIGDIVKDLHWKETYYYIRLKISSTMFLTYGNTGEPIHLIGINYFSPTRHVIFICNIYKDNKWINKL